MATAPTPRSAPLPVAALAGVTATVTVFALAQGLSYPLFTFLMQEQGMPPAMIGLSAAMTPLGIIASAPFVPRLTRLVGGPTLAITCAITASVLLFLVGTLQNGWAWFLLRFLIGVAIDPLYVLSEVWMISLAPAAKRGRIMGLYTAIVGAGFAGGPLTLYLVGTTGWAPFAIGIAAFLACVAILVVIGPRLPTMLDDHAAVPLKSFLHLAPALLMATAVAAAFEQTILSLLPVYGAAYGIAAVTMSALLTVMISGNIVLQLPLGLLAERVSPRLLLIGCAAISAGGVALLPVFVATPVVWPLLFVVGATGYGIYTMALIELGNRFTGSALVAGNAAFAVMWGLGGIAGPPGAGFAIQAFGPQGLPAVLMAMCVALVVFALYREKVRRRSGD
ncbi:MFS transporter [Aquibium carbonis]|uniref:MFS transporter n=1 Tax=Aquibium carbonis TaxID=2495581 RepID=A0A429YS86_9HYPH|nr:MFS transporter [Aquibium carbonis]RST84313.1 MFS transporter [Aquibium carbonis]